MSKYWIFFFYFTFLCPCGIVKVKINIHSILVVRKFCLREANYFAVSYVTVRYEMYWPRWSELGFLCSEHVWSALCVYTAGVRVAGLYAANAPDCLTAAPLSACTTTQALPLPTVERRVSGCWGLSPLWGHRQQFNMKPLDFLGTISKTVQYCQVLGSWWNLFITFWYTFVLSCVWMNIWHKSNLFIWYIISF